MYKRQRNIQKSHILRLFIVGVNYTHLNSSKDIIILQNKNCFYNDDLVYLHKRSSYLQNSLRGKGYLTYFRKIFLKIFLTRVEKGKSQVSRKPDKLLK